MIGHTKLGTQVSHYRILAPKGGGHATAVLIMEFVDGEDLAQRTSTAMAR